MQRVYMVRTYVRWFPQCCREVQLTRPKQNMPSAKCRTATACSIHRTFKLPQPPVVSSETDRKSHWGNFKYTRLVRTLLPQWPLWSLAKKAAGVNPWAVLQIPVFPRAHLHTFLRCNNSQTYVRSGQLEITSAPAVAHNTLYSNHDLQT